jgi:8-oxo-dGTP pyrophosphatase MutT (NUDIX family)
MNNDDYLRADLLLRLAEYADSYPNEKHVVSKFCKLVNSSMPFSNQQRYAHFTASSIVIERQKRIVLMIYHHKVGRWLQPGGHVESSIDRTVSDAARRECAEETGVIIEDNTLAPACLLDLDIHRIAKQPRVESHFHYDIRFLLILSKRPNLILEGTKWLDLDQLANLRDKSISRFAVKVQKIIG